MKFHLKKAKKTKWQQQSTQKCFSLVIVALLSISIITSYSISAYGQSNVNSTPSAPPSQTKTIRIGYFPNINHAQAVIGLNNGDFQKILGNDIKLETFVFNAGPSATEALLAKRIDATYVGPNPAINGYIVTGGKDVRIVSGAASGGASFVVRNDSGISSAADLGGKKFASPQLGNTQDISLRKYIQDNGYSTVDKGGNVTVLPVSNSDILTLFLKKEIDGAWVPEPWATRLIKEGGGKILIDERDLWPPEGKFVTSNIVVRTDYLSENPETVKKLLEAHVNETQWINSNKEVAIKEFNNQLKKPTGQTISEDVLKDALTRLDITYDPIKISLYKDANDAYDLGLLEKGKAGPDLSNIYDLAILNQVLAEKGLQPIDQGISISGANQAGNNTSANNTSGDALADIVT